MRVTLVSRADVPNKNDTVFPTAVLQQVVRQLNEKSVPVELGYQDSYETRPEYIVGESEKDATFDGEKINVGIIFADIESERLREKWTPEKLEKMITDGELHVGMNLRASCIVRDNKRIVQADDNLKLHCLNLIKEPA